MADTSSLWTGRALIMGVSLALGVSACGSSSPPKTSAASARPNGSGVTVAGGPRPTGLVEPITTTTDPDRAIGSVAPDVVAPTASEATLLTAVASPATTTTTPTPTPQTECERSTTTMMVDGRAVYIETPSATSPAAVIVAVHGYKGTPQGLAQYSSLTSLADAGAAIVLYPAGEPLDLGFGWNSGATKFATHAPDDVAVLSDVVIASLSLPCADTSRVYLVGESNGGGMALRAGCDARFAGRLAGIVLVNAAVDKGVLSTCSHGARAVPVLAVAGLLDKVVGYDGSHRPFIATETWFNSVASVVAGCGGSTLRVVSAHVTAHDGSACTSCATLYTIDNGGHTWPGATQAVNGAAIGSFPLTDVLRDVVDHAVNACGA
jgi:polyhydroxybutyrate depolymerase